MIQWGLLTKLALAYKYRYFKASFFLGINFPQDGRKGTERNKKKKQ
jgi:hypothetical protein